MQHLPIKHALISVSNKQGIIPFAKALHALGISILSTGGTADLLRREQIPVQETSELTEFPEIMDGRVKTLHPKIFGGILGKRIEHAAIAEAHAIPWIDLVVVNLYPFAEVIQKPGTTFEDAIENIDIGGPSMIRAAAKNMDHVTVIVDPADYDNVISQIQNQKGLTHAQRKALARKAFTHTAQYDSLISSYLTSLDNVDFPDFMLIPVQKTSTLRYGENPHQQASAYRLLESEHGILDAKMHQGKPLSYNNLLDGNAAFNCARDFESPTCVIVKHCNPCGVAIATTIHTAFMKAWQADSTSAFGGIIALNRTCDLETAQAVSETFFELLIAPGFTDDALVHLSSKPAMRILEIPFKTTEDRLEYQFIRGGVLIQTSGHGIPDVRQFKVVTEKFPDPESMETLLFGWKLVKHVKSNAVVLVKENQTLGIGPGQVSRVDAVETALRKAGAQSKGAVLASDAFFPFRDSIDLLAKAGIKALIQPGGSIRDKEVIDACNQHGIAMVFTGIRCFKH